MRVLSGATIRVGRATEISDDHETISQELHVATLVWAPGSRCTPKRVDPLAISLWHRFCSRFHLNVNLFWMYLEDDLGILYVRKPCRFFL